MCLVAVRASVGMVACHFPLLLFFFFFLSLFLSLTSAGRCAVPLLFCCWACWPGLPPRTCTRTRFRKRTSRTCSTTRMSARPGPPANAVRPSSNARRLSANARRPIDCATRKKGAKLFTMDAKTRRAASARPGTTKVRSRVIAQLRVGFLILFSLSRPQLGGIRQHVHFNRLRGRAAQKVLQQVARSSRMPPHLQGVLPLKRTI